MTLAIFDLDNTLLAGDSDHAWGEFLVEEGIVDRDDYKRANDQFYQDYLNGEMDIHRYLSFALAPLAQHDLSTLHAWRAQFVEEKIKPMMQVKAAQLLDRHRQQGHTLMIITATNRFVTAPIAELLDIEHLIAVEPEMKDGRYTGGVTGVPSFQEGKITRLNDWLLQHHRNLEGAWFYSDSINDAPLLKLVPNAVAVDPDPRLADLAKGSGWEIMSLRD
ncbi:HAD family hydrolase [Marinobacter sp. X15-166B]|uniref:histidinol-phosphatase n=1 Tax=Marinobacter sp. X15-166B TaxID=1897620 RepID=UPI00085C1BEB|nr:HAD family hydrolase [Marinobacter sp. X15-166B]OEY67990.1 phosphoserine phosphatase [Marinobacter sp. X15-166B]